MFHLFFILFELQCKSSSEFFVESCLVPIKSAFKIRLKSIRLVIEIPVNATMPVILLIISIRLQYKYRVTHSQNKQRPRNKMKNTANI